MITKEQISIKQNFPILNRKIHGNALIYFDSAASSQMPKSVWKSMAEYQFNHHANIHRGVHTLSIESTYIVENIRTKIKNWINAKEDEEIIFTSGTTESINLVAYGFTQHFLNPGDEVILTEMEHHSNIVPWQLSSQKMNIKIKTIPINENGELCLEMLDSLINPKTKIIAITHASNVLGTINPIHRIIQIAQHYNIPTLIDGAQYIVHHHVDVQKLNCSFYAFSSHKMHGPTGIGVLYGKKEWLKKLPPWKGGGGMIDQVQFDGTTYASLPHKFEAGTPAILSIIGLGAAISFLSCPEYQSIKQEIKLLATYLRKELKKQDDIIIHGKARSTLPIITFSHKRFHANDIGTILNQKGIAVRTGHHCTLPLHKKLNVTSTIRISLAIFNTKEDIERFLEALSLACNLLNE